MILFKKLLLATLICLLLTGGELLAQTPRPTPTLYITPTEEGFEVYLTAAIHKKNVPLTVISTPDKAAYTLTTAQIEVTKESTGGKIARCLFAYCAGIDDKSSTSATLVSHDGVVAWSYSVNKGRGAKNRQSMAEAIAKHLKDYLTKKKAR